MARDLSWGRRENIRWGILDGAPLHEFDAEEVRTVADDMRRKGRFVPVLVSIGVVGGAVASVAIPDGYLFVFVVGWSLVFAWNWYQERRKVNDALARLEPPERHGSTKEVGDSGEDK